MYMQDVLNSLLYLLRDKLNSLSSKLEAEHTNEYLTADLDPGLCI